jgi:GH24 family phage-related lysozyme (muramidase)
MITIALNLMLAANIARAARPDLPPSDLRARACQATLTIGPGETRSVDVVALEATYGQPAFAQVILVDHEANEHHVLRTVTLPIRDLRTQPALKSILFLRDDQIESRYLDATAYAAYTRAYERLGTVDVTIGLESRRPPEYQGSNALLVGDVIEANGAHHLVVTHAGSPRYQTSEGPILATKYLTLPIGAAPAVGMEIPRGRLVPFEIEEYSYTIAQDPVALLGRARFKGEVYAEEDFWFEGRITSFVPRPPEPTALVQVTVRNFRDQTSPRAKPKASFSDQSR